MLQAALSARQVHFCPEGFQALCTEMIVDLGGLFKVRTVRLLHGPAIDHLLGLSGAPAFKHRAAEGATRRLLQGHGA